MSGGLGGSHSKVSFGLGYLCIAVVNNMASFKFNFGVESECDESTVSAGVYDPTLQKAEEIEVPGDALFLTDFTQDNVVLNEGTAFKILNIKQVEERMKTLHKTGSSRVVDASLSNTDLVPTLYEGGLKIWECAVDLVEFLQQSKVEFEDKRVLELGCGAGLPGIFGLLKGSACVDFQDYNHEVIQNFTIPNVFINLNSSISQCSKYEIKNLLSQKCHFYAGDWKCLEDYINPNKDANQLYDIILTSETIYNTRNQKKLLDFIRNHLRYPSGLVYLAAKTCYFGVGGGTREFELLVNKSEDFTVSVSRVYQEGVQREILTMAWKK